MESCCPEMSAFFSPFCMMQCILKWTDCFLLHSLQYSIHCSSYCLMLDYCMVDKVKNNKNVHGKGVVPTVKQGHSL